MTSASPFAYRSLVGDEIRLIKLCGGRQSGDVRCTIEHVALSAKPRFTALSYVWGDPADIAPIRLDGKEFNVSTNLRAGLARMCGPPSAQNDPDGRLGDEWLWVDAICINQQDVTEKSAQVPRMTDIYSSARQVLAWLGENEPDEVAALKLVFDLPRLVVADVGRSGKNPNQYVADTVLQPLSRSFLFAAVAQSVPGVDTEAVTRALCLLYRRPWWRRVWIIQEAVLARGRLVWMAGPYAAHALLLDFFLDCWESSAKLTRYDEVFGSVKRESKLMEVENHLRMAPPAVNTPAAFARALQELILQTWSHKSTLPHDLVYGRLGIFGTEMLPRHMMPNYSLPFEAVFHDYAVFFLENTGSLAILKTEARQLEGVPSWVPDFRSFMNSAGLKPATPSAVRISSHRQILTVEGRRLATILHVHGRHTYEGIDIQATRTSVRSFVRWINEVMCPMLGATADDIVTKQWLPLLGAELDEHKSTSLRNCFEWLRDSDEQRSPNAAWLYFEINQIAWCLGGYEAFVTTDGVAGYCLRRDGSLAPGDVVCAWKGMNLPTVVRSTAEGYLYLGPCLFGHEFSGQALNAAFFAGNEERWDLI